MADGWPRCGTCGRSLNRSGYCPECDPVPYGTDIDVIRVEGAKRCEVCGARYDRHPYDTLNTDEGTPYLHIPCPGVFDTYDNPRMKT